MVCPENAVFVIEQDREVAVKQPCGPWLAPATSAAMLSARLSGLLYS